MKLRFEVDQADCFRHGIDCPKSIITIEVDPATLPQDERNLIADRLDGINVTDGIGVEPDFNLVLADRPTYEALLTAIRKLNQEQ